MPDQPTPAGAEPPTPDRSLPGAPDSDIPERLAYNVVLPEFEGPLDLLLYLCKTHELPIVDIPIAFVTEKYLEYLDRMSELAVEVAAEYLVMAATLCYLKARELVPAPEPEDAAPVEEESGMDPREELIRRLLEYQKYKDAADQLAARPVEGLSVFPRGMPAWEGPRPEGALAEHSPWKLIEAYAALVAKAGEAAPTHSVVMDRMSVADRINQLVDRLDAGGGAFRFDSVVELSLPEPELRHQLVVTLLAILEMARLRMIRVLRDEASGTFYVARTASAASRPGVTAQTDAAAEPRGEPHAEVEPHHEDPSRELAAQGQPQGEGGARAGDDPGARDGAGQPAGDEPGARDGD